MDWDRAIEINRQALRRIVAELIAMLGLMAGRAPERLAIPAYRAVLSVLRPAESAVRRLIVLAARDLVAELSPARPVPKKVHAHRTKCNARMSFRLFDPRRNFSRVRRSPASKAVPRIRLLDYDPRIPMLHASPPPAIAAVQEPDGTVSASCVQRRLAAIKAALEDLPGQAKRMARWRAKRHRMPYARFKSPLRPGRPPGFRSRPRHEVDRILKECHTLAWSVMRGDTS